MTMVNGQYVDDWVQPGWARLNRVESLWPPGKELPKIGALYRMMPTHPGSVFKNNGVYQRSTESGLASIIYPGCDVVLLLFGLEDSLWDDCRHVVGHFILGDRMVWRDCWPSFWRTWFIEVK